MNNPDKNKQPIQDPASPDKQQPGKSDPTPVQPPPDKPEIDPIPEEVPDRDVPRKPADPQAKPAEQAFERQTPGE
ncbi:hypothetical protein [Chitinophaga sp. MM2321]|uniref:hypothetical protein n=1 Tax=Chitinophaga sp. MM2321 TaxID=3137178 RepID=UPI0032D57ADF